MVAIIISKEEEEVQEVEEEEEVQEVEEEEEVQEVEEEEEVQEVEEEEEEERVERTWPLERLPYFLLHYYHNALWGIMCTHHLVLPTYNEHL